jgi:hypothetical protein
MRLIRNIIASSLLMIVASGLISWPALAALNQPAQVIGMPFMSTDCVIYTMPASFGGFLWTEFNSTSLALLDEEKLDIDFPLFRDVQGHGTILGPASVNAGDVGATANVLPFGLVNLAFPSIRQTVNQSIDYVDTYFFTDTLGIGL